MQQKVAIARKIEH